MQAHSTIVPFPRLDPASPSDHTEGRSLLEAALAYAHVGFKVLPLHHPLAGACSCRAGCGATGKHPATKHGVNDATIDEDQIRGWWSSDPDFGVGLATGHGLTVLDVDARHDGFTSLGQLGAMPPTPTVETGGGGLHLYFAGDAKTRFGFAPGLDLLGDGSYVVAPPSVHKDGPRYRWGPLAGLEELPLAALPPLLLDVTQAAVALGPGEPILKGQRNGTLTRFAGGMRGLGMSAAGMRAALVIENTRCVPALDEAEVLGIAASIARYPPGANQSKVSERLGHLALLPWIPLPHVALTDRRFGITPAESKAMQLVLAGHMGDFRWGSFGQAFRAKQLGIERTTLGKQLTSLRRKGFVAVAPDASHWTPEMKQAPLFYCGEPYIVIEHLWAASDRPELGDLLRAQGLRRMARFVVAIEAGQWQWRLGDLIAGPDSAREVANLFLAAYWPPELDESVNVFENY